MKTAPIILLTDYGLKDHYAGVLRGVILSVSPSTPVLDLTHGIDPQNIAHGAYALENSYRYFPKGSLFLCVVDPGVGSSRKLLAVKTSHYYFFAPDNGLLDLVLRQEEKVEIRSIENTKLFLPSVSKTFHGRDILAPAAAHLSKNGSAFFSKLGPIQKNYQCLKTKTPQISSKQITGEILFFDHFGNAVTNIKRSHATSALWQKARIKIGSVQISQIVSCYSHISGKLGCLFNSSDHFEIAAPNGSAKSILKQTSSVTVTFED